MARDGFDTQSRWAFEAADSTVRPRDEPPPEHSPLRQSVLPVAMVLVGLGLVVAAIVASPGWGTYILGSVLAALGIALLLWRLVRWNALVRLVVAVVAGAVLIAVAVVVVWGLPSSPPLKGSVVGGPTSARIGSIVYSGAAPGDDTGGAVRAYDLAAGRLRWRGPAGTRLLAVTPQMIVVAGDGTVLGLDPKSGRMRWRRSASPDIRGVAYDGGVLVTGQVVGKRGEAVAYNLRSGAVAWTDRAEYPVAEVGDAAGVRNGLASSQPAVLMEKQSGHEAILPRISLVRCATGRRLLRFPRDFAHQGARIVDGVLINQDPSSGDLVQRRFAGWSATTGKKLWSIPIPEKRSEGSMGHRFPEYWDFGEGSGPTVAIPEDPGDGDIMDSRRFLLLDVHDGSERRVAPPRGWRVADILFDARGPQIWAKVSGSGGRVGLWHVGTPDVLRLDGSRIGSFISAGAGWAYLSGTRRDLVGDPHPVMWVLSAAGRLYGPLPARNSWPTYVVDGLVRIGDGVYPLS